MAKKIWDTGSSSYVLEVENLNVETVDPKPAGYLLRLGASGAYINSLILGALGVVVAMLLHLVKTHTLEVVQSSCGRLLDFLGAIPVSCPSRGKHPAPKESALHSLVATSVESRRNRSLDLVLIASVLRNTLFKKGIEEADSGEATGRLADSAGKAIRDIIKSHNANPGVKKIFVNICGREISMLLFDCFEQCWFIVSYSHYDHSSGFSQKLPLR